ncbi:MAG: DMT family transporter [Gammaproteobacteria bacterium]|nr:DMT family transporter [Gammaproteobacteria bacterium]
MRGWDGLRRRGAGAVLASALLFGVSMPLAKILLHHADAGVVAGLLYLGSGTGLIVYRRIVRAGAVHVPRRDWPWLLAAITTGGVIGPLLLMVGLAHLPAANASLLLNTETPMTAALAWAVFGEHVDRRIVAGLSAIVAGAILLGGRLHGVQAVTSWPAMAVLGACLAWALDNNFTRKVSLLDAAWLASVKGLAAGSINLLLALAAGAVLPAWRDVGAALLLGFFAYGVSLVFFVLGLRHLGAARAGGYFATAPFLGAVAAVILGEPVTPVLLFAAALMGFGVWLQLSEHHEHVHTHTALAHEHEHTHDIHHQHTHALPVVPGMRHTHWHVHEPLSHSHPHFPDAHHDHDH